MPLRAEDIAAGAVAYFDVGTLNADEDVSRPAFPTTRNGPFVCYQQVGNQSVWTPITTQFRRERLEIKAEWRSGGSPAWRENDQFVNDGATTYGGPADAFVWAASDEAPFDVRPAVTEPGVAAIVAEVRQRGGTLLEP
jgi:hypothetical protein